MKQQKTIAVAYDLNFRQAGEILRGVSEHMQKEALNWRLVPPQQKREQKNKYKRKHK